MAGSALALVLFLDRVITELEKLKEEQINDLLGLHKGSSLYSSEDAQNDPELRWTMMAIDDLVILRKKVIEGDTSR